MALNNRLVDLISRRYGRLVVVAECYRVDKKTYAPCRCDCGNTGTYQTGNLNSGLTRSCGCLAREIHSIAGTKNKTHGQSRSVNGGPTLTYRSWSAMLNRCYNPSNAAYVKYGARGISVTKPWRDSFESFLNDMGERPLGRSIDRFDNRFGYFLANCHWGTPHEQSLNRAPWKRRTKAEMIAARWL